jgi:hypothetical protein
MISSKLYVFFIFLDNGKSIRFYPLEEESYQIITIQQLDKVFITNQLKT